MTRHGSPYIRFGGARKEARTRAAVLIAVALSLWAVAPLGAQEVAGALEGRVLAAQGEEIVSAEVSAMGPALQGSRSIVTDSRGRFILHALSAGTYDVTIRRLGYGPVRYQGVQVYLGATTSLGDIRLEAQANITRPISRKAASIRTT